MSDEDNKKFLNMSGRITKLEILTEVLREEFKEIKGVLKNIDEHIRQSIVSHEQVKNVISQQQFIRVELSDLKEQFGEHQKQNEAFRFEARYWAKVGSIIGSLFIVFSSWVVPFLLEKLFK